MSEKVCNFSKSGKPRGQSAEDLIYGFAGNLRSV